MAKVQARNSESFDRLLSRFKRQVIEDGIIDQAKDRQFFKSKGQKAKEAKNVARRRNQKRMRKEAELLQRQ